MIKSKVTYAAIALLTLGFTGCSNDEDFVPQDNLKDTPVTVSAVVEGMSTRSDYNAGNLPTKFYLTMTQDTENPTSMYNYTDVEMTKGDGNTYVSATPLLWAGTDQSAAVITAYTFEGTAINIPTTQNTVDAMCAIDLLGAVNGNEGGVTITDRNINISFRHLLCKLDVTFTWGTEFSAEEKSITGISYNGVGLDATIDRTTSVVGKGTAFGNVNAYFTTADEGETYVAEAIIAPQVNEPKIVIATTIGGVARSFQASVDAPENGLVAGYRYTMNVKIGTDAAVVSTAKCVSWNDADNNGSFATEQ